MRLAQPLVWPLPFNSQDPSLEEWEGHFMKILPITPDDPQPDLEERLAVLQPLGPTEFEPGERELAAPCWRDRTASAVRASKESRVVSLERIPLDSNHLSVYLDRTFMVRPLLLDIVGFVLPLVAGLLLFWPDRRFAGCQRLSTSAC